MANPAEAVHKAKTPKPAKRATQALGQAGEAWAAAYLQGKGLHILERNWRQGRYELDIIATDGDTLVFVEVKTRSAGGMGSPAEAITPHKQRSVITAARAYLAASQAWQQPCRFDVICCVEKGNTSQPPQHKEPDSGFSRAISRCISRLFPPRSPNFSPNFTPKFTVEHFYNAFDLTDSPNTARAATLGRGNTSWQPW